jgi:hypothetical protein
MSKEARTSPYAAEPTSARRWNNFAATSSARHWPTSVCNALPLGESC